MLNWIKKRRAYIKEHPEEKITTTKIIVFSLLIPYYIAFFVGVHIVLVKAEYIYLGELFAFVGAVTAIAVAFYCWKAKAENLEKIKRTNPDLEGTLSDFSNMQSQ